MDNQPPAPTNNNLSQSPAPDPAAPLQPPIASSIPPMSGQPINPMDGAVSQPNKKKSRKGLIIGMICAALVLIGGGVAAAIIVTKIQPSSMMASAIGNLLTAKQVTIDGQVSLSASQLPGDNSIVINFNANSSNSDYSTTATMQANLPILGITSPLTLELSDVMISDGIMYFKVKGLQDTLTEENISAVAMGLGFTSTSIPIDFIQNVSAILEDKWIKVSLEELAQRFPQFGLSQQMERIECERGILGDISKYSSEMTSIYSNSPFLIMEQQNDSFYNLSLNTTELADFANSLSSTQLIKDLAGCSGVEVNSNTYSKVSSDDLKSFEEQFPSVSVKFDGFLDYYLSELKVSDKQGSSFINTTTDLKFSYNANPTITAPTEATSAADIIQTIMMMSSPSMIYDNCSPGTNCTTGVEEYNYEEDTDIDEFIYDISEN